jgi:hypothetical protein
MTSLTFTRCALFLVISGGLAAAGCKGKEAAPAATDDARAATPPPVPADAAAPDAAAPADGPAAGELSFECKGGVTRATARATTPDSAEITIGEADHFSQKYQFTFAGEALTAVALDETSWSFSGGTDAEGNSNTKDKVKRVAYTFAGDGKAPTCTVKTAEGPTREVAALLDKAPAKAQKCADVARVQELAKHVRAGEAGKADLVALVCK